METGVLKVGALLRGGLGCTWTDGGCKVEGEGTTLYGGGDNIIAPGLGDTDGSLPVIFSVTGASAGGGNITGVGGDNITGVGGGNVTGGCNEGPEMWKNNF